MPGPRHPWMYFLDTGGNAYEIFNGARTTAYLKNIGLPNGMLVCDILDDGGCSAYPYAPPCGEETEWTELVFTEPDLDPAPWYNSLQPESADALGFWVDDWTGLDNGHVSASVIPRGGYGGGSQRSPLSAAGRTMAFGVQLFAHSEAAMEYLFRWLEQTLYNVCAGCATDSVLIRRFCPSDTVDLWAGVARMNNVGIISGPQWENELTSHNQCFYRRISFVMSVGDPCLYLPGDAVAQDQTADLATCLPLLTLDSATVPCRPSCLEIAASTSCYDSWFYDVPSMDAAQQPVLTMHNDTLEYTVPVRVHVYYDPLEVQTSPSVVDPCGLQVLGQLYVAPLRPGATLIWDVAARDVLYRDHTTGTFVDGWAFVQANDPPLRRWFSLPCGQVIVVMELATLCLDALGGGSYSDGTHQYDDPHYPVSTLEIVPRVGCP